jgi:hypothetical protein
MSLPIYLVHQLKIKVGKKMLVVSAFAYRMPYVIHHLSIYIYIYIDY